MAKPEIKFYLFICMMCLAVILGLYMITKHLSAHAIKSAKSAKESAKSALEVTNGVSIMAYQLKLYIESTKKEYYKDSNDSIFRGEDWMNQFPAEIKSKLIDYRKRICRPLMIHELEIALADYTKDRTWIGFRSHKNMAVTKEELRRQVDSVHYPFYT